MELYLDTIRTLGCHVSLNRQRYRPLLFSALLIIDPFWCSSSASQQLDIVLFASVDWWNTYISWIEYYYPMWWLLHMYISTKYSSVAKNVSKKQFTYIVSNSFQQSVMLNRISLIKSGVSFQMNHFQKLVVSKSFSSLWIRIAEYHQ